MKLPNPPKQIESFAVAIFELLWFFIRLSAVIILTIVKAYSHYHNNVRAYVTGYRKPSHLTSYKPVKE